MTVEILGDQEEAIQWKELQDTLLIADLESEQESEQLEIEVLLLCFCACLKSSMMFFFAGSC